MQPQPSLYSAASRADEYEWEGLANSKRQTASKRFGLRHLYDLCLLPVPTAFPCRLFAVYCLLFAVFSLLSACLLLPCPFRIILSLLEARSYRPVGSRPLFLLGE